MNTCTCPRRNDVIHDPGCIHFKRSGAYALLSAAEQAGYDAFCQDQTLDACPWNQLSELDRLSWISGWFVAAREAFAEGAVAGHANINGIDVFNPYPSGSHLVYNCNSNFRGESAWFRAVDDQLKPRARQWHQGFRWSYEQDA